MPAWTIDDSGRSFTSILGMDPRADFLLGAGFRQFQPAGPDALIPFLLAAITISWFGMQRRKWQQGSDK